MKVIGMIGEWLRAQYHCPDKHPLAVDEEVKQSVREASHALSNAAMVFEKASLDMKRNAQALLVLGQNMHNRGLGDA